MITLSTYTEPPQLNPVLNELSRIAPALQNHEIEEDSEPSEFAELLAGLMQKNGTESEAAQEEQTNELSALELDALSGALVGATEKLNLFGEMPQDGKVSDPELFIDKFLQEEPQEAEILSEQANALFGAENVLANFQTAPSDEIAADGEDLPREIADVKIDTDLKTLQNEAELSPFNESAQADKLAQTAAQNAQEAQVSEAKSKKAKLNSETEQVIAPQKSRSEEIASLRLAHGRAASEKESKGKLDEARKAGKGKDKVSFEVRDFRTASGAEGQKSVEMRVNAGMESQSRSQGAVREVTLELRLPDQGQNSAPTSWEAKAGNALENMLARELHQNFNGDIVRHASMALKDGGEGTIRLALKPESLGNVKISLEMTENKITGRIVVESEEALNAFKKEIASLEQAFRDSGYANADLDLSLAADGRNAQGQERETASALSKIAALRYDNSIRDGADQNLFPIVDVFYGRKQGTVNMLA